MKKSVVVLFIVFAMFNVAWSKSSNETKLEKVNFSFLTANSLSWTFIYDFLKKKELSNKRSLIILINIKNCLMAMKYSLPSAGTNNPNKESSIYCNIRSNNTILVKRITSSPDLVN